SAGHHRRPGGSRHEGGWSAWRAGGPLPGAIDDREAPATKEAGPHGGRADRSREPSTTREPPATE
ncbi:MAG: hypothetical protein OXF79_03175, partial [Chloroflexi bacterium]|nr:hypothetical protein [Chloroflexota bacterium]